jgi:transmembrane sensor
MMRDQLAKDLLKKYKEGTLTEDEMALLESWYLSQARSVDNTLDADELEKQLDIVWKSLPVNRPPAQKKKGGTRPLLVWIAAAACVVVASTLAVNVFYKKPVAPGVINMAMAEDAMPGESRARLTLASGQSIMLHEASNGKLAQEGKFAVIKAKQGELVYQFDQQRAGVGENHGYNTVTTPKAGQYQVKLPDGTRVWLNAASSIRFPTVFQGKERVVEIVGEAYFEVVKVSKNKKRVPFKVKAGNQLVEVLGTRFNVNSYADESTIKTTLLEGSIKLEAKGNNQGVLLKPGQQAEFLQGADRKSTSVFDVKNVDSQSVVAWKEGYFRFDNVGLPELMRQLSRWYDMEVVYEGKSKEYEFVGQIERNTRLSKVLQILELGDVHFRIENKKIIVTD